MTFTPLPWEARLNIMKGVAKGMSFLHEFSPKKYVHGDLRPNNILLGTNMGPYISDFGLGRLANIAGTSPFTQSDRVGLEKAQSQQSDASVSPLMSKRVMLPSTRSTEDAETVAEMGRLLLRCGLA